MNRVAEHKQFYLKRRHRLRLHVRRQRGSFALEAALALPPLLLTVLFLISMCMSVQAEMRLKTALDRTAAEISLLPPLVFSLVDESSIQLPISDLLNSIGSVDTGADGSDTGESTDSGTGGGGEAAEQLRSALLEIIQPDKLEVLVSDALLDLASSALLADIVEARINYWQERLGLSNKLSAPQIWLDWNLKDDQLFLEADYEIRTILGKTNHRATALLPIWRSTDNASASESDSNSENDADNVWQLDNFSRGRKLRAIYGGNLPASYPVIAKFAQGEALSIKSMDLTKPTYSQPQAVEQAVTEQFLRLAGFAGTAKPYGSSKIWIKAEDITARRLLLVVPADSDFGLYQDTFRNLSIKAESMGLDFNLVTYGKAGIPENP